MKFSLSLLASTAAVAAANSTNPFAPKVSRNTAKSQINAKLMLRATPLRKLQDNDDEAEEVDLSGYSIKFEKCQFVKQYAYTGNNNNKNGQHADFILATKQFVVFRMCPDNSCGTCNYNYGEYIVDMDSYLAYTLEAKLQEQEQYCQLCDQCVEAAANAANGDDANGDNVLAVVVVASTAAVVGAHAEDDKMLGGQDGVGILSILIVVLVAIVVVGILLDELTLFELDGVAGEVDFLGLVVVVLELTEGGGAQHELGVHLGLGGVAADLGCEGVGGGSGGDGGRGGEEGKRELRLMRLI